MDKNKKNTDNLNATFQNMTNLFSGFGDLDGFGGCGGSLQTLILILMLSNGCENSSYIWILLLLLLSNSDEDNNILWIIILLFLFCNGNGFGGAAN